MKLREKTLRKAKLTNRYDMPIQEYWFEPTNTHTKVIKNSALKHINEISETRRAIKICGLSQVAIASIASSEMAMAIGVASSVFRTACIETPFAMDNINLVDLALRQWVCIPAGLDYTNYPNINSVITSESAMAAIAASSTAMANGVASSAFRTACNKSPIAMNNIDMVDRALRQWICIPAGLDHTDYPNINSVITSESAMAAIAASSTAMANGVASSAFRNTCIETPSAMDNIHLVDQALRQWVCEPAGLNYSDYLNINSVITSESTMTAIAASSTAMTNLAGSTLLMNIVSELPETLTVIFSSWTAREIIWNNATASSIMMTGTSRTWMISNCAISRGHGGVGTSIIADNRKGYVLSASARYSSLDYSDTWIRPSFGYIGTSGESGITVVRSGTYSTRVHKLSLYSGKVCRTVTGVCVSASISVTFIPMQEIQE